MSGFKSSVDQLTLLLGGDATHDLKSKPIYHLPIHHLPFWNVGALKNYVISTQSVLYKWTNKAWMIAHLFMTWLTKYLKPEKKIPLKVLLFIDKVPGHRRTLMKTYNEINYVFLPANTTAILQLMNQGVILTFKLFKK